MAAERTLDELVEAARLHQMSNAEVRAQKLAMIEAGSSEAEIRRSLGYPTIEEEAVLKALRERRVMLAQWNDAIGSLIPVESPIT